MESLENLIGDEEESRGCLSVLRCSLDASRSIMRDIRDWTERIRPSDVFSHGPLAEAVDPLEHLARSLDINLVTDIGDRSAITDQPRVPLLAFVQIGRILMENTRLHNPHRHDLQFTIRLVGEGRRCIRFMDNGRGIPQEDRSRIFDPFFTTQGLGRMGLGLPLAYWIACERFGGMRLGLEPSEFVLNLE